MKRLFAVVAVSVCLLSSPVCAQEGADTDASFPEMEEKFLDEGLTEIEIRNIEVSAKNMLYVGASAKDIEGAIIDLKKMGLDGRVLSDSVFSMSYLVSMGESVNDAKKVVEDAAREAMSKRIMGKNLAIEIEKRVKQKSQELWKKKK
ncbi:MAG: hypothetical protein WBD00_07475 [Candidatus Omnitrophota bacterium]